MIRCILADVGRFDAHALPMQSAMELLVEGLLDKYRFQNKNKDFQNLTADGDDVYVLHWTRADAAFLPNGCELHPE